MQSNKIKYIKAIILSIIVIILGIVYISDDNNDVMLVKDDHNISEAITEAESDGAAKPSQQPDSDNLVSITETPVKDMVMVHVCGAVKAPGVYQAEEASRIIDVINMAGGMLETAANDYLNLASVLNDGMKIYVPFEDEIEAVGLPKDLTNQSILSSNLQETVNDSLVNINTADKSLLMTLTGIGEAKAAEIINYREQNGAFSKLEDIMLVPGIKEAAFSKIKNRICIR